ncbi:MAG: hypothetical protein QOF23_1052 [Solirubrobacterales bacterium]|jgi:uncharacterized protein YvpB|nr:hypothetical protein [Solirubrobacterales bacterium]
MSARPRGRRPSPAVVRRRRVATAAAVVAVAVVVAIVAGGFGSTGGSGPDPAPRYVRVVIAGRTIARRRLSELRRPAAAAALLRSLPASETRRRGGARIVYEVDRTATAATLRRVVRSGGGAVSVREAPVSASIGVPLIKQALPDDCEVTSLSMVLAYMGRPAGQLALQKQVAQAKPLDPTTAPDGSEVWGDPSLGFVGHADGGGPGGGFGVYQRPIRDLAGRHGVPLRELTGSGPDAIYAALLHGHPVIAWVALSNGPYATWVSPAGKPIEINYGEHVLVLTGVEGQVVHVNDPLSGTRLTWSKSQFEQMWEGLGRRALAA